MKSELRKRLRAALEAVGPESIRARSARAAHALIESPEYQRSEILMTYLSLPLEADTTPVVLHAWQKDKRVLAPLVQWDVRQMIPVEINSLESDVVQDDSGFRQPAEGDPIPIELIDLVIVPGLGFDGHGNRLGRGRGFYDRFLAHPKFRGVACGLAVEEQVVEQIPADGHDMPIHMLVTDRMVRRFSPKRSTPT